MTHFTLIGLLALAACVAAQQGANFVDYDYQETLPSRPPQRPARPQQNFGPIRTSGPEAPRPTPVPILKQINRHNDDGSYTYGYEGADGSFKIETKLPSGDVMGKYGYVDDTGKLRVVDYGANRYGFQPAGEGITVAPPTLVDESTRKGPNGEPLEYDDGSYYEPQPAPRPVSRPAKRPKVSAPVRPPPPPPQSYHNYEDEQEYVAPVARPVHRPSHSQAPTPARAVVSGAAPVGGSSYTAPQHFSAPAPQHFSAPAPVRRPAPVREHHARASSGVLDSLAQQYALPQGSAQPLHDISFGSYSSQTSF